VIKLDNFILKKAVITNKGICYQDKYYSCPIAIKENWFNYSLIKEETTYTIVIINIKENRVIAATSPNTGKMHEVWQLNKPITSEDSEYFEKLNILKQSIKHKKKKHDLKES